MTEPSQAQAGPELAYVWSRELERAASRLPSNIGRSHMVHSLIRALDIVTTVAPDPALGTRKQLLRYHTEGDGDSDSDSDDSSHGLEDDCPPFDGMQAYMTLVAAATLTACNLLLSGTRIAINWDGGRHHALRDRASGFCYVADIQLGIMALAKRGRVLYLDMDLHYGDGVASAFHSGIVKKTPRVCTLSVHHSSPTFYPPPTPLSLLSRDHPFSISIPLEAYPSNKTYAAIWPSVQGVFEAYRPDFVVLQMGADALAGDPVAKWGNWSTHGEGGMVWVAQRVKYWGVPLCVLGGGGYNHANTARAWAAVTAVLAGSDTVDVPHHDNFPDYAPNYTLEVDAGGMRDENTYKHLARVNDTLAIIAEQIRSL